MLVLVSSRNGALIDARFCINLELYVAVLRKLRTSAGVVGGDMSVRALMCLCCTDTPFSLKQWP